MQHGDVVIAIDYVELREIVISVNGLFRSCLDAVKAAQDTRVSAVSFSPGQTARSKELILPLFCIVSILYEKELT